MDPDPEKKMSTWPVGEPGIPLGPFPSNFFFFTAAAPDRENDRRWTRFQPMTKNGRDKTFVREIRASVSGRYSFLLNILGQCIILAAKASASHHVRRFLSAIQIFFDYGILNWGMEATIDHGGERASEMMRTWGKACKEASSGVALRIICRD